MCYIAIWWSWVHKNVFKCRGWPFVKMYEFFFLCLAYFREFPFCLFVFWFCLMVRLVFCFTSLRICGYYCFHLSYFVGLHFMLIFFYEYYLNPSLSIVSTSVLINPRFSVFSLLVYYVYLFHVNISTVFFNILVIFLGFQYPPPQFVPILCAHLGLALTSQQKP